MRFERPLLPPRAHVLRAIDTLVDRACTLEDLEHHGLQLFAGRRWRILGRPVPDRLVAQERMAAVISLAAPAVLQRVRAAYEGELLLLKGPEAAVSYPDPCLRGFGDLDLLVRDSRAAERALLAAGFEPFGDERRYMSLHHRPPLRLRGLPIVVELHHAPKWPKGLEPPTGDELLDLAEPARCGVDGLLGLPAAVHAIVLAAHAWAHAPLGNLRHLVDVCLVASDAGPTDWRALTERWGVSRLWETTVGGLAGIFGTAPRRAALTLWARHLASVRERTVLERHVANWMSPLWSFSGLEAIRNGGAALAADLEPLPGESWAHKLARIRLALADAFVDASEHHILQRAAFSDTGASVRAAPTRLLERDSPRPGSGDVV